jgi:hypothetical protein
MTVLALRWKATRQLADPRLVLLPRWSVADLGLAVKMAFGGVALFAS